MLSAVSCAYVARFTHARAEAVIAELEGYFDIDGLAIDKRLLQALTVTDDAVGFFAPSSYSVITAGLARYPLLSASLQEVGVHLERFTQSSQYDYIVGDKGPYGDVLDYQLETWFEHPATGEPSDAYWRVRDSRRLSLVDILNGCLETTYLSDASDISLYESHPDVNDVVGELARASDALSRHRPGSSGWRDHYDRFASKLHDSLAEPLSIDPSHGDQQFLLFHDGYRIRIRPFGAFAGGTFAEDRLLDGSLWVARGNIIEPAQRFSDDAIHTLEDLINSDAPENAFQRFFEEHDEFLVALGDYSAVHSQLILHEDDGGSLIPDFFLEKMDSTLADICDLKRSNVELIRAQRNRHRFRSAVQEAVAQLAAYRDYFDDRENRAQFRSKYGLDSFRPRVVVIVGRRHSFNDDVARIKAESQLPTWVTLKTYDDVVAKARQWRRLASSTVPRGRPSSQ